MSLNELFGFPALILVTGPLVAFGLVLLGPVLLVVTIVALLAAIVLVVALAGAVVASPYLLYRHLARRRLARATGDVAAAAAPVVHLEPRRAVA